LFLAQEFRAVRPLQCFKIVLSVYFWVFPCLLSFGLICFTYASLVSPGFALYITCFVVISL